VVELTIRDTLASAWAPGLVLQDDEGLLGLQLVRYDLKTKVWTTLLARRLPSGAPAVWFDGELETPVETSQGPLFLDQNTLSIESTMGPLVSLRQRHQVSMGALYFANARRAITLSAPAGQRVTLPAIVGEDAVPGLLARLEETPPGQPPLSTIGAGRDGFAISWEDEQGVRAGLTLLASSESQFLGHTAKLAGVPPGLTPFLELSPSTPQRIGHPRGCASIGLAGANLLVQRRGEAVLHKVPLPLPLRRSTMLGVQWLTLDDPFKLSQLPPSGDATHRALAPVAPPVKFR
jgi:hypothetical protein